MMSFEILTKVRSEREPSKSLGKVMRGDGDEVLGTNEPFLSLAHFHPRLVNVSVSKSDQVRHGDALIRRGQQENQIQGHFSMY